MTFFIWGMKIIEKYDKIEFRVCGQCNIQRTLKLLQNCFFLFLKRIYPKIVLYTKQILQKETSKKSSTFKTSKTSCHV